MKVALGKFAQSGIEARLGADVAAGVQEALRHYSRRLRSGWPPVAIPLFCRDRPPRSAPRETEVAFDLAVDPEIERDLKREATRQGAPIAQVLNHAVFVYLADLDTASSPGRNRNQAQTTVTS